MTFFSPSADGPSAYAREFWRKSQACGMSCTVVKKVVSTSDFDAFWGSQRRIGLLRRSFEDNLDSSVLRQRKGTSTFSSVLANFPAEFLEIWGRGNANCNAQCGVV